MNLQRREVASKFYGKHNNINTEDKDSAINYLNEIENYLNNYKYESNSDFIFCGRKKFIYDEIVEIMNGIKPVNNPVYFILGSLEEFLSNNNDVHISDADALGMSWNELRDANDRYISTGTICLEEKKYIDDIINRIKSMLAVKDRLNNYEGEFKVLKSICEVCVNYNGGKRNDKCPLDLIDKIENNEMTCPNFKKEDLFEKRINEIHQSSNQRTAEISREVFNKIINLPVNKQFIIGQFLENYNLETKDMFEVQKEVLNLCENNNVEIKKLTPNNALGGMPWSSPYVKIESSNELPINKGINTLQEEPWVNYVEIDDITLERKLSDDAPEEIKIKYQEYINKKIDSAIDLLSKKIKEIDNDKEITVLELLGTQPERYNDRELTKIATSFFDKNKDSIEFVNNPNDKVGLLYNLPFKKKRIMNSDNNTYNDDGDDRKTISFICNNCGNTSTMTFRREFTKGNKVHARCFTCGNEVTADNPFN